MTDHEKCVSLLDQVLDKAEKLFDSEPVKGYQYLRSANRLYNQLEDEQGFDFEKWQRLNHLCLRYFDRYLP